MKSPRGLCKLKLNNFINIVQFIKSDLKLDFTNWTIFNSSNIEEIYISYFRIIEIIPLILEWNIILKMDGVLRIDVPDFENVVKKQRY